MSTLAALPDPRTCPLDEADPFHPDLMQDPAPFWRRLRAEAPVWRDPKSGVIHVSTYEAVMEVNRQPRLFSNNFGAQLRAGSAGAVDPDIAAVMAQGVRPVDTLLTADPPTHTRFRRLAVKAFTMKRVDGMGPYVAQVCHQLVDAFAADGACEFKTAFADRLPMIVIADALGVPRGDMPAFKRWSDAFVTQLGGAGDKAERLEAARLIVEFQRYFIAKIAEKRKRPTEDIISDLVQADLSEEGDPRKMTDEELLSIAQQFLVAGNETTAHTLTAGLHHLITEPGLADAVRERPELVDGFVEETLRLLSPTNNMWRLATEDARIGEVAVCKGDLILLRYGCANRDEAEFPDADRFDPERANARNHLAFGAGIHTCIGALLARKEMTTAFPILLDRLRDLRLADPAAPLRHPPNLLLRGVERLNVVFRPTSTGTDAHVGQA